MKMFYLIVLFISLKCVYLQYIPPNPCPNLFRYLEDNGIIYGRLQFQNDYSGYYELVVNMSVITILPSNQNIRLELLTTANELVAGRAVVYNILFPVQNVIPRPTRIEFNRRLYCTGPQEQVIPGRGITNMWAATYYRVTITPVSTRPNSVFDVEFEEPSINNRPSDLGNTRPTFPSPPLTFPSPPPTLPFTPPSFPSPPPTRPQTPPTRPRPPPTTAPSRRPTTAPNRRPTTTSSTRSTTPTPFTSPLQTTTSSTPLFFGIQSNNPSFTSEVSNINPAMQCGESSANVQPLIINGDSVEEGEYPWMVAIMYRQDLNYRYGCTGSLVSNLHVVTAAHCVWFFNAPLYPLEDLVLVFGKVSLKNWANRAIIRDIKNITAHPDYKMNKGDGDIAVLTLQQPIQFQNSIQPVCLWQESDDLDMIVGQQGAIAGWGRDESGQNFVIDARKTRMPIVSQVTCLRSDPDFTNVTSSRTFCAGSLNGSGPCTGDSGAGFVMLRKGKWTLRGVVAVALKESGTCSLSTYTVFADAAKLKDWLTKSLV